MSDVAELIRWFEHRGTGRASVLRWYRSVGFARHHGVSVDMTEPPALEGTDIEYLPGDRTVIDGRPMTADEILLAERMLEQMASDARDALSGLSTLVVVHR